MSENTEQQAPKRRRKSGWDVQTPVESTSAPSNEALLQQQAQQAMLAQQLALQKAHQLIAQQALQKTFGGISMISKPGCRIYVGSIHYDLKESDIVTLFSTFGPVVRSEMTLDPVTQRSKGFCFVEYDDPAFAQAAMAMDGFELAGRKIKVGWPTHGQGSMSTQQPGLPLLPGANPLLQALNVGGVAAPSFEDTKASCVLISNVASKASVAEVQDKLLPFGTIIQCKLVPVENIPTTTTSSTASSTGTTTATTNAIVVEYTDIPSATKAAFSMNAFVLYDEAFKCEVITKARMKQLLTIDTSTFCTVKLESMVTVEDTKDPGLKDEIAEEANNYGKLKDIELDIDTITNTVEVRLIYEDSISATKAYKAMNGRAFAGNKIIAVLAP